MALVIALAMAASAQSMTAGDFLSRAELLMKKSRMALIFSSDARGLIKILGEAADRNRKQLDAARAAGKPVSTCLPPKGKASVETGELLAYLRTLSPAERSQSFERAFGGYTARKYPCRS